MTKNHPPTLRQVCPNPLHTPFSSRYSRLLFSSPPSSAVKQERHHHQNPVRSYICNGEKLSNPYALSGLHHHRSIIAPYRIMTVFRKRRKSSERIRQTHIFTSLTQPFLPRSPLKLYTPTQTDTFAMKLVYTNTRRTQSTFLPVQKRRS